MRVYDLILGAIRLGVALRRKLLPTPPIGPMTDDEVRATLQAAAQDQPDANDWQNSIVDLMKILRLDSSFKNRTDLWAELSCDKTYEGTAEQNQQLHAALITRIAHRGLTVP